MTRARLLIEVECVRDAILNGDDLWEASVVAAYHHLDMLTKRDGESGNWQELEARNHSFHLAIVSGCSSPTLVDYWQRLFIRHYRYRRYALQNSSIVTNAQKEHEKLLCAVVERDADGATELTRSHIIRTQESAELLIAAFAAEAGGKRADNDLSRTRFG